MQVHSHELSKYWNVFLPDTTALIRSPINAPTTLVAMAPGNTKLAPPWTPDYAVLLLYQCVCYGSCTPDSFFWCPGITSAHLRPRLLSITRSFPRVALTWPLTRTATSVKTHSLRSVVELYVYWLIEFWQQSYKEGEQRWVGLVISFLLEADNELR